MISGPREVGVLGANGFGQVVRKQRRVLVPRAAGALQPRRDPGMETRPLRLRETRIGNFPSQRVRDREHAQQQAHAAKTVLTHHLAP